MATLAQRPVRRAAGQAVGLTLVLAGFLPVLVIVALAPAVPALIDHFARVAGATTLIPLLVTTPGLVVALIAPGAGLVVDRIGRRGPLLAATACYAAIGMAPLLFTGLAAITASRLGVGICEAFVVVAVNALLSDCFDPDRRRFWFAVQGVATPFLVAGVAVLTGRLTSWTWNGAFAAYALVVPICLAIAGFCAEPERPAPAPRTERTGGFPVWPSVAIVAGTMVGCVIFYVYVVQVGLAYAAVGTRSAAAIGRFIGLATLAAPIGGVLFAVISKRLNAESAVAACLVVMGSGMLLIGRASTEGQVLAGSVVQQVSAGMLMPALLYWVSGVYRPGHRGRAFGLWSSASFLSQFASPLLVGALRPVTGGILPVFFVFGLASLAGAAMMAVLGWRPLPRAAE